MHLPDVIYRAQVMALALFRPSLLFHRINQLPWYRDTLRRWVDALVPAPGASLLEVGCATGLLASYLAERGAKVTAVDRSAAMLRKARGREDGAVTFRQADIMALPYGEDGFDYVVSASVINVLSDPRAAIGELVRVCKPGGHVSILVPSDAWDATRRAGLLGSLALVGFSAAALVMWDRLATKVDQHQLQQWLRMAGLEELEISEYLDGLVIAVTGRKRGTMSTV